MSRINLLILSRRAILSRADSSYRIACPIWVVVCESAPNWSGVKYGCDVWFGGLVSNFRLQIWKYCDWNDELNISIDCSLWLHSNWLNGINYWWLRQSCQTNWIVRGEWDMHCELNSSAINLVTCRFFFSKGLFGWKFVILKMKWCSSFGNWSRFHNSDIYKGL